MTGGGTGDLIAAGTLGLIAAVGAFDPDRGIEFSTFAVPRIRGAVLDELRRQDWVPRTARNRAAQLADAMGECVSDNGSFGFREVARRMGVSVVRLAKLLASVRRVAFVPLAHSQRSDDDALGPEQIIADDRADNPEEQAERAEQFQALQVALESLPEVQRNLIEGYYFENREQKEIARELRVSRSRVSQIHNSALANLRRELELLGAA